MKNVSQTTLELSRDATNRHALQFSKDYDGVVRASGFMQENLGHSGPAPRMN